MLNQKTLNADLCVIGGGMAGICAAIAAARCGAKVVLMHERPVLGGNASSEIRMWMCGAGGENNRETGIVEEIALENYYRNPTKNYYIWDTVLYDFVIREKNITLLLNCTCMDAKCERGNFKHGRSTKILSVKGYQMTTQTFYEVCAENYADCSGDSILAPLVGAEFKIGRESADEFDEDTHVKTHDRLTMGNSCLIQGRETDKNIKFTPPKFSTKLTEENFKERRPDIYNSYENFWYLELGGNRDTIADAEDITRELVPLATGAWDYIKNSGSFNADKWDLEFLGFLPGKRESRRMTGEYIITERDIVKNRIFDDTVAYGGWPLDDHFPDGFYHKGTPNTDIKTPAPYCIPYRAMYSKNVENLFFAGRNISMTHMAMSSIRVMLTCALMGQAVGTAAAIAHRFGLTPHEVYLNKLELLQNTLLDNDCFLPNKKREIGSLCKETDIINGNNTLNNGEDRPHRIYGSDCGVAVTNSTALEYRFDKPEYVTSVHITFDSDLNRETLSGDECERYHSMRSNILKDSLQLYVPKTLCKEFILECETENGRTEVILNEGNNLTRAHNAEINRNVKIIRLIPLTNWGETDKTTVFSFDFK